MTTDTRTQSMIEAAHALPADYLEALADHGEEALSDWLKDHAPANVAEAFDRYNMVRLAASYAREGTLRKAMPDESLLESVAALAKAVTDLGGTWHTPTGWIIRQDDKSTDSLTDERN